MRVIVAMTAAAGIAALGQIILCRGMREVGSLEHYAPLSLLSYFGRALSNPYVIAGTVLNAIFYGLILAALSWTDATVALPLTAIEYVFVALLAVALLGEVVPPLRWAGVALVVLGVTLISMSANAP